MLRNHDPSLVTEVKPEIDERAHGFALEAVSDIEGRALFGDVFAGARATGLEDQLAHDLAVRVTGDPEMVQLIVVDGGLLVGAIQALQLQEALPAPEGQNG